MVKHLTVIIQLHLGDLIGARELEIGFVQLPQLFAESLH